MNVEMRLTSVPGVACLAYWFSGTYLLTRPDTHTPVLKVSEDEVHVACSEPDVVSYGLAWIHFRRGEIGQAVHGGGDGPGDRAVYRITKDRVPFELSWEHPLRPGAERAGLGNVKSVCLRAA
jgi:hypothetical protein